MRPVTAPNGQAEGGLDTEVNAAEREQREATAKAWRQAAEAGEHAEAVAILASLSAIEFDQVRAEAAKLLGCRLSTLTEEVAKRRAPQKAEASGDGASGKPLTFEEPEPWPEPVEPGALLEELVTAIRRHVSLPDEAALATALWAVMTHLIDRIEIAPRLLIKSPQPRCGKTTLLDLLARLVPRPVPANNVTPAVVFRLIDRHRPTLLIDEADTFLRESEELRGVVNSGHRRSLAWVIRNVEVGGDWEPRQFSTWCAMAIAGIGRQHATIEDRSIAIGLQRRLAGERVERLDEDARKRLREVGRRIVRLVQDFGPIIASTRPREPDRLHDRAMDNWRPLLAVAELAGETWAERARHAAVEISGGDDAETLGVMLLADIRAIFQEQKNPKGISTGKLLEHLHAMEDRPWGEWRHGKPMTPAALARALKPFGIRPKHSDTGNGYMREAFADIWRRYLPPPKEPEASDLQESNSDAGFGTSRTFSPRPTAEGLSPASIPCVASDPEGLKVRDPGTGPECETEVI